MRWTAVMTIACHAGSRGARLLQKMEGPAAPSSLSKPGCAPISEGMRVASRARLAQAMQGSPACTYVPSIPQAAEVHQILLDPTHTRVAAHPMLGSALEGRAHGKSVPCHTAGTCVWRSLIGRDISCTNAGMLPVYQAVSSSLKSGFVPCSAGCRSRLLQRQRQQAGVHQQAGAARTLCGDP